jgi:hypothetical protein
MRVNSLLGNFWPQATQLRSGMCRVLGKPPPLTGLASGESILAATPAVIVATPARAS